MKIHLFSFLAGYACCEITMNPYSGAGVLEICVQPTKNENSCIFVTSGPMELTLCSFVVLMSTSKLWNMNRNGLLVIEIAYDLYLILSLNRLLE